MDSSPFASRLDSNYAATDSESLEIQTLLKLPTSRLEELSNQLQELDDQHTHLRNEQSSLLVFKSNHSALISLIRKLPIDILQKIFIACLPTAHNAVMSRWEPPILLTQICSSWRNVAHATPQLWKSIHVVVPCHKSENYSDYRCFSSTLVEHIDRCSEAVLEWLSRSAAYPLDISVGHWAKTVLDGFCDTIINTLIRFSERWRDVRLSARSVALLPVVTLPPSKVPLLETLSLNFLSDYHREQSNPQSVWMTTGVLKAPKLRDLWLHGVFLSLGKVEDVTQLPINWSQLTNISLEGVTWNPSSHSLTVSKAYKLLFLCRNLITCRLEIGNMTSLTLTGSAKKISLKSTAHISLPFLTKLSVIENTSLSRLFSLLHLPSLNSIEQNLNAYPSYSLVFLSLISIRS